MASTRVARSRRTSWESWPPGCELLVETCARQRLAYDHYALAPSSCPLSANEANPIACSVHALSDCDFGVEFHAHAEVELEGWGGDSE